MLRPALLLCLALLTGCRERPPSRITADSAAGIGVDPQTVPGRVALELWSLRPGIGLGTWSLTNLNDIIAPADTQVLAEYFGDWCAVSTRVSELAGRRVIRQAYFYAPEPAPDRALPDTPSAELVRDCVLGLIWVRVSVADAADGQRLADSVLAQLAAAYQRDTSQVSFFGSAWWTAVGRFRRGGTEVVSALRTSQALAGEADSTPPRDLSVFAALPLSGVGFGRGPAVDAAHADTGERPALDSAARASGLDSSLAAPLLRLFTRAESSLALADWRPAPAESLVGPLRRWLLAAADLPAPRRAAALWVADRVLARAQCSYALCQPGDSAAQAPLRALGAEFVFSELGGGWGYARTWLAQARALDRDSPLGQRILLEQMAAGFDFSGTCRGGAEAFRQVIETGERYLARVPDSPIRADVHLLVADGYRDIVALADGAAGIYADSSAFVPGRDSARTRALAHYRDAIAADRAALAAADAWRRAWWLLAGLPARGTRFYCIYD